MLAPRRLPFLATTSGYYLRFLLAGLCCGAVFPTEKLLPDEYFLASFCLLFALSNLVAYESKNWLQTGNFTCGVLTGQVLCRIAARLCSSSDSSTTSGDSSAGNDAERPAWDQFLSWGSKNRGGLASSTTSDQDNIPFRTGVIDVDLFLLQVLLFHVFEFYFVATFHPEEVTFGSFVFNPVPYHLYGIVLLSAVLERHFFWERIISGLSSPVDVLLFRGDENYSETTTSVSTSVTSSALAQRTPPHNPTSFTIGIVLAFSGLLFRVAALWTAGNNFSHVVRTEREKSHQLITKGVYAIFRHPAYVGWLVWSVGTQLILGNRVNFFLYLLIGYVFLYRRIPVEEHFLLSFFGSQYLEYAKTVPCGIPFASDIDAYHRKNKKQ
ncbi:unnamed protein product [Amoebophrya sp. A120]|nr:unnamed protein product [Amoebophrya sp. A120]|eukprot:GSA120T00023332001.1